jgi:hypothetical protein
METSKFWDNFPFYNHTRRALAGRKLFASTLCTTQIITQKINLKKDIIPLTFRCFVFHSKMSSRFLCEWAAVIKRVTLKTLHNPRPGISLYLCIRILLHGRSSRATVISSARREATKVGFGSRKPFRPPRRRQQLELVMANTSSCWLFGLPTPSSSSFRLCLVIEGSCLFVFFCLRRRRHRRTSRKHLTLQRSSVNIKHTSRVSECL